LAEWAQAIAHLPFEERDDEQELYDAFISHGRSPTEWLLDLAEIIVNLDLKIGQLPPQAPQNGHLPALNGNGHHINLPSLQLPEFNGDPEKFFGFWEAFQQAVGENANLNPAQKLTYLFSRLKGAARSGVEGLPLVAANYTIAVDYLKGRYGNESRRAEILQGELIKLPKAVNHPASLRVLSESIERICRQLATHGVDLNANPFVISTLKAKLPPDVLTRLVEKEMDSGGVWTPVQWRNGLIREVQIREAAGIDRDPQHRPPNPNFHRSQNSHFQGRNPQSNNNFRLQQPQLNSRYGPQQPQNFSKSFVRAFPVSNPRKRSLTQSAGPSGQSTLSDQPGPSKTQNRRNINAICSLCKNSGHFPSLCPSYPTPEKRQQRLIQQNRCLLCGRDGHPVEQCTAQVSCLNCRGAHHVIICKNNGKFTGANSQPIGQQRRQHSSVVVENLDHNPVNASVFSNSNF
jgi:hypothetical protein